MSMIDGRERVSGLFMDVRFVLLQFISVCEGDPIKFAAYYAEVCESEPLERVVRACLQYFIEFPSVMCDD